MSISYLSLINAHTCLQVPGKAFRVFPDKHSASNSPLPYNQDALISQWLHSGCEHRDPLAIATDGAWSNLIFCEELPGSIQQYPSEFRVGTNPGDLGTIQDMAWDGAMHEVVVRLHGI